MRSRQGSPCRLGEEEQEVEPGAGAGLGKVAGPGEGLGVEASDSEEDLPDFIFTFCKFIVFIVTTMCAHSHLTQPWDKRRN